MTNMNYKHIILFALFLLRGLTYSGDDPDGPWEIFAEIEINGVMRGRMSDITLNMPGYGGMVVNNKILIIRWQDSWNSEYILSHIRGTDIHYPGGKDWDVLVRWTPFAWTSTGFGQTYAWLPVNGGDCPIPPGITQTDGITFQYEIRIPRPYKDLYFLEDGELKTYGLMCRADDAPPADYGDEYRTASIPVYLYHPYKPGPLPEGDIKKSSGFSTVPTFKWWNQVLSNEEIKMEAVNLWDLDATEKISTGPKDPGALDQIDWNDGFKIDIVTQDKIFWETLEYGLRENGSPAYLIYPGISPGTHGYENWNIDLVIEDTRDGKSAQDPRTIVDNVTYHVYFDHLARDVQNEGDLNAYVPSETNCVGAAYHAKTGFLPENPAPSMGRLIELFCDGLGMSLINCPYTIPPEATPSQKEAFLNNIEQWLLSNSSRGNAIYVSDHGAHIMTFWQGFTIWEKSGNVGTPWQQRSIIDFFQHKLIQNQGIQNIILFQ